MQGVHRFHFGAFLVSIAISLGAGGLSALASRGSMDLYGQIELPPLSPPGWVFPIVWSILYLFMGISAYLVFVSKSPKRRFALTLYAIQLAVNAAWPILYFNFQAYFPAFLWICLLWLLILATLAAFTKIDSRAGLLLVPYLLWVTFAGYLNLGVSLLNS